MTLGGSGIDSGAVSVDSGAVSVDSGAVSVDSGAVSDDSDVVTGEREVEGCVSASPEAAVTLCGVQLTITRPNEKKTASEIPTSGRAAVFNCVWVVNNLKFNYYFLRFLCFSFFYLDFFCDYSIFLYS